MSDQVGLRRDAGHGDTEVNREHMTIRHYPAFDHSNRQPQLESCAQGFAQLLKRYRCTCHLLQIGQAQHYLMPSSVVETLCVLPERAAACVAHAQLRVFLAELPPKNGKQALLEVPLHQRRNHD